ncbi:MAG TPA: head-tail connector protein [Phyllobacterium sp.]|nr:head-tail connector protein [Phyllobacterium sp.]
MSVQLLKRNKAAVSTAWLVLVKSHCRVDFTDDDEYLKDTLDRGMALIERETGLAVCQSEYVWRPDAGSIAPYSAFSGYLSAEASNRCAGGACTGYSVPDSPTQLGAISSFSVFVGGDDVSPLYQLVGAVSPELQPAQQFLVPSGGILERQGAAPISTDMVVRIITGYATPDDTPAGLRDLVLRITAMYYEDREANSGSPSFSPDWLRHALSTLWVPRC